MSATRLLAVLLLGMSLPGMATPPGGGLHLKDGDVIALAGGSGMVKQVESGYLETLLSAEAGTKRLRIRDASWQADTVYRQQRPRNFGTQREFFKRIGATTVIASFGQMEALDGTTEVSRFIAAYEKVLDEVEAVAGRVVLVSPRPFEKTGSELLPDLSLHNGDVAAYAEAIRQLANRRGHVFVDLSGFDPVGRTTDGLQLNAAGQRAWAEAVAAQLLGKEARFDEARMGPLREAIARKNLLWRRHWRPTNWSFLYGNRQHVPSSKDHRPGHPRWFPKEIEAILPMIAEAEERIFNLQEEGR